MAMGWKPSPRGHRSSETWKNGCSGGAERERWSTVSLAEVVTSMIFVETSRVCRDKTPLLSRQNYVSRQNIFVQTEPLSRQIFITTNIILSRQTRVCRDNFFFNFVATELCKYHFCRHKGFVATNILLSLQKFCLDTHTFCRDKRRVFRDKHMFVATNTCLSRQKWYLWQLPPMILYSTLAQTVAYRRLPTISIKTTTKGGLALAFPTRVVW